MNKILNIKTELCRIDSTDPISRLETKIIENVFEYMANALKNKSDVFDHQKDKVLSFIFGLLARLVAEFIWNNLQEDTEGIYLVRREMNNGINAILDQLISDKNPPH